MKRSTKILLWLAFAAIFFIPWLWYANSHEIILGGDLTFPLNPSEYFSSIFHLWRRVYAGTHSAISLTTLPFYGPMALFDTLGFSLKWVQQLHFGLWLAAPALGMFYLAGVLFREHPQKRIGQVIAVTLYLFNTYQVVWADSARMAVWVGLPIMLAFFIQGLRDQKGWWRWAAGIALASILTSTAAANPPMFLMFAAIFIFWLLFYLATEPEARTKASMKRISLFLLVTFGLSILVNLFWIVPYAAVLVSEYSGALKSGLGGIQFQDWLGPVSTNTSLLNVFRLQGAWDWYAGWQGEPYVPAAYPYQHNPFYLWWSVFVPIIAFTALLVRDKLTDRRLVWFLAALSLVGLFFAAGSHLPTGAIYQWLLDHVPFLSIYRSPWYKFSTWTVLGYSLLGAISAMALAAWLTSREKTKSWSPRWLVGTILVLFVVGNLIYSSGLVLGKVFPKKEERVRLNSAHISFPDYFFKAAAWINSQTDDFRILQLPAQEAFNYRWGLGTLMDMTIFTFQKPTIWWPEQTGSGPAKPGSETMAKIAYSELYAGTRPQFSRLLGLLNIKYLLQKNDIDYSFYGGTDSPEFIRPRILKTGATLAHEEGPWQFYEVASVDQRPLFYATNQLIKTAAGEAAMARAIMAADYNSLASYTTEAFDSTRVASGRSIQPDLSKAVVEGNQLTMPFTIDEAGQYDLSYSSDQGVTFTVDGQPVDMTGRLGERPLSLTAGSHTVTITFASSLPNLINNGSFADGLWEQPFDDTPSWPGQTQFSAKVVTGQDGGQAAQVTSSSHAAVIRRGIDQFELGRQYLLSFDYRHDQGNPAKFGVWQEKAFVSDPTAELPKGSGWQHYQTVFQPRSLATGLYLFLYADPGRDNPVPTTASYDSVQAVKVPMAAETVSFSSVETVPPPAPTVTATRISSTAYTLSVKGATQPFVINFLERFDKGWRLSGQDVKSVHLPVYGYANGWIIDKTGDYQLQLDFEPQRRFQAVAIVSFLVIIGCLGLILRRPRNGRKR